MSTTRSQGDDPRFVFVTGVIDDWRRSFREFAPRIINSEATAYLAHDIMIDPERFGAGLAVGTIDRDELTNIFTQILNTAWDLGLQQGAEGIEVEHAEEAAHQVVDRGLGCPVPFIIC